VEARVTSCLFNILDVSYYFSHGDWALEERTPSFHMSDHEYLGNAWGKTLANARLDTLHTARCCTLHAALCTPPLLFPAVCSGGASY
jgi:hypothetical protein